MSDEEKEELEEAVELLRTAIHCRLSSDARNAILDFLWHYELKKAKR